MSTSQPLGREDMFRRHEPSVSSSPTVNMTPRIPSYPIPMSQQAHPPPPPPTLPRPSPVPGYEQQQQQQPLPPLPSSTQQQQHTSPPPQQQHQPIRNSSPNASSGRRTRITRACKLQSISNA